MKILLVVYDNGSHISWFPHGLAYIAAVCRVAGHIVKIYNKDVYHLKESHLTEFLDKEQFDFVGVGACGGYYQYQEILKISAAINNSKNRPTYCLGGHLVSPEPNYFLKKTNADVAVIGEGEETVIELLDALQSGKPLKTVKGIAFMENGKIIQNQRRPLVKNIDDIPFPAYDLFPMDHYTLLQFPHMEKNERSFPILSGRGCPFKCNFCYRMDKGIRTRSIGNIIEEIQMLKKRYNISYFVFSDELLLSSIERVNELCKGFMEADLNIKWNCQGRLNFAKPEILNLMKKAGCVFINYGIECMDDQILKNMNKSLTTKQIIEGIENTLDAKISPGYNIIFGNIGENKQTLENGVNFLLKYDDHSQFRTIRPVTPYPGSPLYYYAIKRGLLKDCADFYENKHLNSDLLCVNFTELSDDQFYEALYAANKRLIEAYSEDLKKNYLEQAKKLYFEKDVSFRGFRQS
ncbi:MAG: radical SAM protein [archaeon]